MFTHTEDRETVYAWFTFSHWLVYANSAANPIIYNFLSGKSKILPSMCVNYNSNQEEEFFSEKVSNTLELQEEYSFKMRPFFSPGSI